MALNLPFKNPTVVGVGVMMPEFVTFKKGDLGTNEVDEKKLRRFLLKTGLAFHKAGYIPIPLRGKIPILSKWQKTTYEEAMDNLEKNTNYNNLGLLTGQTGKVTVVDIDEGGLENFENILEELGLEWPKTYEVKTGSGGIHLYYQWAGPDLKSAPLRTGVAKHLKIDIRNTGGQIVAPGSIHPVTHQVYTVTQNIDPMNMSERLLRKLMSLQ